MKKEPLYQKIVSDIMAQIQSGELRPGDQVPTELEISKHYNVSRITSKRSLTELENQQLIERIQGRGSFVSEQKQVHSNVILFILPFPNNPGLGDYTQGISRFIENSSYTVQIQTNTYLTKLDSKKITSMYAGLILYPEAGTSHLDILYTLYLEKFPVVVLDKKIESIPFPFITSDNMQGGYLATQHLIMQGHKKILFYATQNLERSSTIRERYLGYLKAIHQAKLDYHDSKVVNPKEDTSGFIDKLKEENVTGVIVENDINAIHLMKEIKSCGYQIPEDFSIIGFDNIQASGLIDPGLTTIAQRFEEIGYQSAKQLIQLIDKKQDIQSVIVPIEIIIRESTN
ncbi:substrate-binding domain-containing protein [Niallia sp.]|uniref:GntR family transcriptional regulator n=1 Tax=Niallia sp. TaxID=2837523 RepID=UPI00289D2031|nr:substrate-binding domain-containing protein [Niallia sp.]